MKRSWIIIVLAFCCVFGVLDRSTAGQFDATGVTPKITVNSTSVLVVVDGDATYRGTPDPDDRDALIQTTLEDTFHGPPGTSGNGHNVSGPFSEGQKILCTDAQNGCPGRAFVPRRLCNRPTHRFQGRTGVAIFHVFSPEISLKFGANTQVACIPLSSDCLLGGSGGEKVISVTGGPQIINAVTSDWFPLERIEERDGFRYLMEEWAVVAVDRDPAHGVNGVEMISASSSSYGDYRRQRLLSDIQKSHSSEADEDFFLKDKGVLDGYFRPGRSILLAIDKPRHPRNHRWIPTPVPRLMSEEEKLSGSPGQAIVRADFGEDRSLIDFELLYSDRPLSREEQDRVERNLSLDYFSEKPHRAVLFAVLSVGESIQIERSHVVLPQCCCLPPQCPDNPTFPL